MAINALYKYLLSTFYRTTTVHREKMVKSKIAVGSALIECASSNIFWIIQKKMSNSLISIFRICKLLVF